MLEDCSYVDRIHIKSSSTQDNKEKKSITKDATRKDNQKIQNEGR